MKSPPPDLCWTKTAICVSRASPKGFCPNTAARTIRAPKWRIKEWDYYLISNGRFALALTIDDNGYMGLDSVSLLDLEAGWEITKSPMSALPLGSIHLPETSAVGDTQHSGQGPFPVFQKRRLRSPRALVQMDEFGPLGAISGRSS
jgi:hypothetical protein